MKLIIENFRRFLLRENQAKFAGILKIMPSPDIIAQAQPLVASLPEEAIPLGDDKLHVTLIHQKYLKPYKNILKQMAKEGKPLPQAPQVILKQEKPTERPGGGKTNAEGRRSWVAWVDNQEELKKYVKDFMAMLGAPKEDPEPNRVFHISLANLTGNPGDSVA